MSGEISIPAKVARAARRFDLTERETEVAALLSKAANVATIADTLQISTHTVNFHQRGIYKKFSAHCVAEFFLRAYLLA